MSNASVQLRFQSSDDREIQICKRYWGTDEEGQFLDSLSEMAREYGLTTSKITSMQASACTAIVPGIQCVSCETPCIVANRTAFAFIRRSTDWMCESCQQELQRMHQQRRAALAAEQAARQRACEERQRAIIRRSYPPHPPRIVEADQLSLRDTVFLVATLRCLLSEQYDVLTPSIESSYRIAPHYDFEREVLNTLVRKGLICVSPDSPLNAFSFDDSRALLVDPLRARYDLSLAPDPTEARRIALELETRLRGTDWPASWHDQRRIVAKEIAIETCVGYLLVYMDRKHLPFSPGSKTRDVLAEMLDHFSMSKSFAIIWRSVVGAVNYMVEHKVAENRAANSVVGSMRRRFHQAVIEGAEVKDFRPEPRCCDCSLTQLLFNDLLRSGPEGFFRPLS